MEFIPALKELLNTPKRAVIIPHKNPDADALGSALALTHFLRKKGHTVTVISPNDYPEFLCWLPGQTAILKFSEQQQKCQQHLQKAEVIFTLDFNDLSRIEEMEASVSDVAATFVMIDHHEEPKDYAALTYSDTKMSSTCEMVFNVLNALDNSAIDSDMAVCLYTGIMTDTGSFRFPTTSAATHKVIASLIEKGAKNSQIHEKIYDTFSFSRIQLLGKVLSNITKVDGLPAVFMTLNQKDLDQFDFKKGDTEGFVNYGLSIEGIQLAVIMIQNKSEGKIKMSFRSKGRFSVNEFARTFFEGGGHHNAAGGKSLVSMDATVAKFLEAVKSWAHAFED